MLADKARRDTLYRQLRHARKKVRKRYGAYDHRGRIKGRVSIDEGPAIVDTRQRIGDWENDAIIGKRHKGALLNLVERKTKFTLIRTLEKKQTDLVAECARDLLNPYEEKMFTITSDNGREFAHHKYIEEHLKTGVYFSHPYHAWERGLCKNTNGLIRQYLPKRMNFEAITDEHVHVAMNRLNIRPKKSLGCKILNEVFFQTVMKQAA